MKETTILSISASDTTGQSGMQADVRTINEMGGHALSAVTSVCTTGQLGGQHSYDLDPQWVVEQAESALATGTTSVVKIGMVHSADTIRALGPVLKGFASEEGHSVVCAPGIRSSTGRQLLDKEALEALQQTLVPLATLLVIRCSEAELLLGRTIATDDDMTEAAQSLLEIGADWVMLRGGLQTEGRCTALLYGHGFSRFFASYNIEGWQQHGVGGALSAAIATRMAMGDDVPTAVSHAHDYVHNQVVYAIRPDSHHLRPSDLYNQMLSLVAQHYSTSHNVAFYAQRLAISPRYLSQMTNKYVGKSPKEVIANYLVKEAKILLETSLLTIQEIALRLGFGSQTLFGRFFKQHTGMQPSAWRRRNSARQGSGDQQ